MDCDVIRLDLAGFHFGELEEEPRRRVEAHLLACRECLQAFLALKRNVEAASGRFSESGQARLRAAVQQHVAARQPPRPWPWWQRPLAVALAAAAVLLAAGAAGGMAASPGGAPHAWPKPSARAAP